MSYSPLVNSENVRPVFLRMLCMMGFHASSWERGDADQALDGGHLSLWISANVLTDLDAESAPSRSRRRRARLRWPAIDSPVSQSGLLDAAQLPLALAAIALGVQTGHF